MRGLVLLVALVGALGAISCQAEEAPTPPFDACRQMQQAVPIGVGNPPSGISPVEVVDSAQLREALEGICASGACWLKLTGALYEGPFVIPGGAFLEGVVVENTAPIVKNRAGVEGEAALQLTGGVEGCPQTVARNLSIENLVGSGISALGGGVVVLEGVSVKTGRGAAVAAGGVEGLWLRDVVLRSNLTVEALREVPEELSLEQFPAVGLLVDDVGRAILERTDVAGFAGYGAALRDSRVDWWQSVASQNQGYGVFVTGPRARITFAGGAIRATLRSNQWRSYVPIGLVLRDQAQADSQDLELVDNEGVGALQDGASAVHVGLVASDNNLPGYWLQSSQGVEGAPALRLEGARLERNTLAGLVALSSDGVALEDVVIGQTRPSNRFEGLELEQVADGAQLVGLRGEVSLRAVSLRDNRRAGLLLDGTGALEPATFAFDSVEVSAAEVNQDTFGVVQQELLADVALDGITIQDTLRANDQQLQTPLPVTGASASPRPQSDARWLAEDGLLSPTGAPRAGANAGASGL